MHSSQLSRNVFSEAERVDLLAAPKNREPERLGSLRLHEPAETDGRSQEGSGEHIGYRLLRHGGRFFAVPKVFGPVCLADRRQRSNPWIFSAANLNQLRIDLDRRAKEGTLPLYLETLEGHAILSCGEAFYAIEPNRPDDGFDDAEDANPKVLVEDSLPELRRRILELEEGDLPGAVLGTFEGYGLTQLEGNVLAFPLAMQGAAALPAGDWPDAGVLRGKTRQHVEEAIENPPQVRQVQFTGWLPVFHEFGNCGAHPQFGHVDVPPVGYAFIQTPPPAGPAPPILRWKPPRGQSPPQGEDRHGLREIDGGLPGKRVSPAGNGQFSHDAKSGFAGVAAAAQSAPLFDERPLYAGPGSLGDRSRGHHEPALPIRP